MKNRLPFREHVLASFGAGLRETAELLAYNQNVFALTPEAFHFPLEDEPFVSAWRDYARAVRDANSILPLADYLVQLRFPIEPGMSETPEYLEAIRHGILSESRQRSGGCGLAFPERCRIMIHPTVAGHIPLLIAEEREDFITLVRALTRKNEPAAVPSSMGAAMVAGFNNWHRIQLLRQEYERRGGNEWEKQFQRIKAQKPLYQDRFIILSRGPYSGVNASDLKLEQEEWLGLSLVIRRQHECAHYFTRRVFSSMRNNLLDELIADYFGVTAAAGRFRADWILRFFGLESFPHYRTRSRFENYRGNPPLSDGSFKVLQSLLCQAVQNVELFDRDLACQFRSVQVQTATFTTLAGFTLEELASKNGLGLLRNKFAGCMAALASSCGSGFPVRAGETVQLRS